jgi:hypothetical protein
MPREYYDRGQSKEILVPASRVEQDEYWQRQSALAQVVAENFDELCILCPGIRKAAEAVKQLLVSCPGRSFKRFRPEDQDFEVDASEPALGFFR